ncbi:hypothetical protein AXG93_3137s1170 [Marchantia polymorpha subsp. ruderalis]|uniref:Uncharacterized protein n=1 Tax=Marchantia polymorpha subsp. ruderalis TaxID=1480154 RepID=A0A176W3T4_MARPO|nr:hypothetical protein AXG93_3137s1170 [Marchantia polymorpha subsp. ruderalis]
MMAILPSIVRASRTKVKAIRLIVEANSNTESGVDASQGRPDSKVVAELEAETAVAEKYVPFEKYLLTSVVRPTPVVKHRATRKEKGKAIMTEEGTLGRDQVHSAEAKVRISLEKSAEVLKVSSDTEEDPVALKKIAMKIGDDIEGDTSAQPLVASPRTSTGTVILKTGEDSLAEEIQSKGVNVADVLCGQVIRLLRYLNRKETRGVSIAFNDKSQRVDELTADSRKKDQAYATQVAAKVKALAECEVKTQKWLHLRILECRVTAMIACSVSGQRQLARKLDVFLTSSCEAMANLELELTTIVRRLGLDRKSDSKATTDSADVMSV